MRTKTILILLLLQGLLMFTSCQKQSGRKAFNKQVVKKGMHYTLQPNYFIVRNNYKVERSYKIMFDKTCLYQSDSQHWNKATGWYFGGRDNSSRLGWRPNATGDSITVINYSYSKGNKVLSNWLHQATIGVDEAHSLTIKKEGGSITMFIDNKQLGEIVKMDVSENKWITHSNFYFGGNPKAPQKMYYFYRLLND